MPRSSPGSSVSIDDELGDDHQAIGALLEALAAAAPPEAGVLFERLDRMLRHHMTWEEEHLFPAVWARATGAQRRSIESLEIDHERLRRVLDAMASAVGSGDAPGTVALVGSLKTFLQGHNYDEEHGVYVEADRFLPPEERRRLLEAFEAGRAEGGGGGRI